MKKKSQILREKYSFSSSVLFIILLMLSWQNKVNTFGGDTEFQTDYISFSNWLINFEGLDTVHHLENSQNIKECNFTQHWANRQSSRDQRKYIQRYKNNIYDSL